MKASCAPYKFCKQKGGARKTRKLLPKLRKISYKNKKHHYKLKDPFRKRKLAIHEGVNREAKKTGKTKKKAAIAKKGRFNILRIYRKNKKIKECNTITHDMRYMDRKYGLGKTKNICGQKGGTRKKKTRKKQFLYNPNDPSKSFDVYIDKNPNDTIPIKYTTVKDVEDTIKKLERLYKTKKYPHKRIWQVGMIMKVRLEAMNKYKKTRYIKAKKVFQRFQLANKYFKFLGERTKKKTFLERKKMTFNYKMPRRKTRKKQKGGYRMKEKIMKFKKGPFPKKYTAIVKDIKSKKTRKIHFGDRRYQQYKDRTPLKLYAKNNHNTRKRMQNYFNRHSGTKKRSKAIKKEKIKSRGKYNAKILSHIFLW